jgi:hypothetical protein
MPGSTFFGGASVPRPFDNCSLKVVPPDGAIFSGGGDGEFCGASGTVGFSGGAGCGFCACAEEIARSSTELTKRHFIFEAFVVVQAPRAPMPTLTREAPVRSAGGWNSAATVTHPQSLKYSERQTAPRRARRGNRRVR